MREISVLGDSISTFAGYNPVGYSVYYDPFRQAQNGLGSVCDTWWDMVIRLMDGRLCVNNSYSGSKVTGKSFPAGVSEKRLRHLGTDHADPDFILVYMGMNDFAGGTELVSSLDTFGFEDCYDLMLRTIRSNYPQARIICGTLMRTRVRGRRDWAFPESFAGIGFEEYNEAIRQAARQNHCFLVDAGWGSERYETLDGFHPTAQGHAEIARKWRNCLISRDSSS